MRNFSLEITAATLLVLSSACTSDGNSHIDDGGSGPGALGHVTPEPAWTLEGYSAFAPVISAGDTFILYAVDEDDELVALGVDASSGNVLWKEYTTHSHTYPQHRIAADSLENQAVIMSFFGQGDGYAV